VSVSSPRWRRARWDGATPSGRLRSFDGISEPFLLPVICRDEKEQVDLFHHLHSEGIQVKAPISEKPGII